MGKEQCCLIIFSHPDEVRNAVDGLRAAGLDTLMLSIIRKPGDEDEAALFIRLPRIGTVVCEGPFSSLLRDQRDRVLESRAGSRAERTGDLGGLASALHEVGVPMNWHGAYERALLRNQILMVAVGSEDNMRRLCAILEDIGAYEPVLYLR